MVAECRQLLGQVLPLTADEVAFLDLLNDHGKIAPERLTGEESQQEAIRSHPGLLWKALNVRQHLAQQGRAAGGNKINR